MLTGAWLGFLDSGSNETDNWRRRRRAMTKAVWSTPMAKVSSVARIAQGRVRSNAFAESGRQSALFKARH